MEKFPYIFNFPIVFVEFHVLSLTLNIEAAKNHKCTNQKITHSTVGQQKNSRLTLGTEKKI